MNIFVGNLSCQVTEEELRQAFKAFGQVTGGCWCVVWEGRESARF